MVYVQGTAFLARHYCNKKTMPAHMILLSKNCTLRMTLAVVCSGSSDSLVVNNDPGLYSVGEELPPYTCCGSQFHSRNASQARQWKPQKNNHWWLEICKGCFSSLKELYGNLSRNSYIYRLWKLNKYWNWQNIFWPLDDDFPSVRSKTKTGVLGYSKTAK